ncbi:unnamed protein product [Rotaria sordida]|uniref:Uncharacterized protein n=1 Tax=Rotaria sordida TaxID=392033 RepID=A0A814PF24_9BILA|nr:unnamed protein product [Rotaria sordida]
MPTLTTLILSWNEIGAHGAQYLVDALLCNTTLNTLDLYNNQIGTLVAQHLGDALRNNTTLTILDLGYNQTRGKQKPPL